MEVWEKDYFSLGCIYPASIKPIYTMARRGTTPRNMIINQLVGGSIKPPIRNRTCENKSNHKDPRMFFIRLFFSLRVNQYPNSATFGQYRYQYPDLLNCLRKYVDSARMMALYFAARRFVF